MKTVCRLALLFLTADFPVVSAQTYTFTTIGGVSGHGAADGTGSFARFNYPYGVAVDGNGNVFVADSGNNTIRKITAAGVVTTLAGSPGHRGSTDGVGSAARFSGPSGVAVDGSGNVFVTDVGNHTIRKITADGVVTTLAGSPGERGNADGTGTAARFDFPLSMAVDGSGSLFVADWLSGGNQTVRKITAAGVVTTLALISGSGRVAVDDSGNVFLSGYNSIQKITADGVITKLPAHIFSGGIGVAVDGSGNVFFADNHTIRKITSDGVVTTLAGLEGELGSTDGTGTDARFRFPVDLAVDGSGSVFVSDIGNNTIRKITAGGVVTTLAGLASSLDYIYLTPIGVAVDGKANVFVAGYNNGYGDNNYVIRKVTSAGVVTTVGEAISWPSGVAADGSGNLFVTDGYSHMIFKLSADGVVTHLAGQSQLNDDNGYRLVGGSNDGTGGEARFSGPSGVAVDGSGNLFVADTGNHTIRKITVGGLVTTLAGSAGSPGSTDGTGSAARFNFPVGVAVDGSGNVFVADSGNNAIRKITAVGVVTTLAGEFSSPMGVAVDGSGNVFVADSGNHTIRKITADGIVTTVAASGGVDGSADGMGSAARFNNPSGVAVDSSGNVFVADAYNDAIRMGVPDVTPPFALTAPQSQHINIGASATFTVVTAGSGFSYQWKKDGVAIAGATGSTYQIASTVTRDMGFYSALVTGAAGTVESPVAILTVATGGTSRLGNFSARGLVPGGGDLTVGFAIRGGAGKSVLVRAVGPTLGSFGVVGALSDPKLDFFPAGAPIATTSNDDWGGGPALAAAFASIGAFPLPAASKDAAVLGTLVVGDHTARVTSSFAGGFGIALTEVYDRDHADAAGRLGNISTLGFVGADAQALAFGFVIDGVAPKNLLIRGVGPGLTSFGMADVLSDPQLSVTSLGKNSAVAINDNWNGDAALARAFVSAGTFALPASSKDAAVVVRLPPGGYTVTVSRVPYSTGGRALVEIYDLDP